MPQAVCQTAAPLSPFESDRVARAALFLRQGRNHRLFEDRCIGYTKLSAARLSVTSPGCKALIPPAYAHRHIAVSHYPFHKAVLAELCDMVEGVS